MIPRPPRSTPFPYTTLFRSFVTDEGHYLLDCAVPPGDVHALARALEATLGVVEHGLFLGLADQALLGRSEEHTSELQSRQYLECRLLLVIKKIIANPTPNLR